MPICARIEQTNDSPIIQPMWNKKGIRHIDVWLDDIGIDVEARTLSTRQKEDKKFSER